jgi:23S rRNA (guanosine2251-2'-O)-methyltransferase
MAANQPRKRIKRSVPPPGQQDQSEILYGLHTVEAALRNSARRIRHVWATQNAAQRLAAVLPAAGIEPEIVTPSALDRIAGPESVHQGVVLEADQLRQPRLDQIARTGIVLLLDQVTDPHNVGAILRTAAAFDATALVTTARHSPQRSAVVAKAASGAVEHVPYVKVINLARALDELKAYGFTVVGLDSAAPDAIESIQAAGPIALVLGAEGKGLRHLTRESCDALVRLELPGPIKSLNVSNAAALALYALWHRPRLRR